MYNFHKIGNNYSYGDPGTDSLIIHPLKILFRQGREIVIFDEEKDFFSHDGRDPYVVPGQVTYGIAIKLNGNKIFKAAEIENVITGAKNPLQVVENIAQSIKFDD